GWGFGRLPWPPSRGTARPPERRFHARDDGWLDGWLTLADDAYSQVALGVTIDPEGNPLAHELPPGLRTMAASGAYGVAIGDRGDLFEPTDHARTCQPAGPSPIPPGTFGSAGCSALGCTIGPIVRAGWGRSSLAPRIDLDPPKAPDPPPPPVR